ncbi:MAG TPA: YfhO family protein [Bacteroidales bacterium]|nr:YfhO family protein [Bacteroidales bacterium]
MRKFQVKNLVPYVVPVILFIVLSLAYMSPLLEGKKLKQDDIIRHKGMSKEIVDFREKTGEEPLWTNSMFGGMPAYQISVKYSANLIQYVDDIMRLGLPRPADWVFLYMLGFFILMLTLRVNPWIGMAGAIAYGFSSYFFIILQAGHNSKAHALAYMAPLLAGVILSYRGKYWLGGILTLLFMALEINAGHPQITYYLGLLVLVLGITELVSAIRKSEYAHFIKSSAVVIVAMLFGVLTNITSLWATYEYGKETIRGKSELTTEEGNRTSGLDKDYATQWSYGKAETGTLIIPDFHGGSSHGKLSENSEVAKVLKQNNIPQSQVNDLLKGMPTYWGTQPFTSGPVYVGAIVFFLFVFGLILIKGNLKWWLLAGTILSILLAWGKNFPFLTDLFLHYFPGYNKFRAVSMTLVIAELTMPILAFVALNELFKNKYEKPQLLKALKISLYFVGGFVLLFVLVPGAFFNFSGPSDVTYSQSFPKWLMDALVADRESMLRMDALRSLIFILLAAGVMWAFIAGKLQKSYVFALITFFVLVDMWPVDKRYLSNDDFVSASTMDRPYKMTQADELILKDKDPNFRVLNLTGDPFADARTSYFHKSIGGYHGAKLRRYQELYEHQIQKNFNIQVLNMLNTKYIIQPDKNNKPTVTPNMGYLGNAWFVPQVEMVENADQELDALTDFDPAKKAVVDKRFEKDLEGFTPSYDTTASIQLIEYAPNQLKYQSNTSKDQLAVFSEIYYDKGWNAYVDGEKVPYFRANYVLRAMVVPAGKHLIEFKFEPRVYAIGEKVSFASSLLVILLVLGFAGMELKKYFKKEE